MANVPHFAKAFAGHRTATQRQRSDFVRERGEFFNSLLVKREASKTIGSICI
jgi:hypothetical protein